MEEKTPIINMEPKDKADKRITKYTFEEIWNAKEPKKNIVLHNVSKSYCKCKEPAYNYPEMVWCNSCGLKINNK